MATTNEDEQSSSFKGFFHRSLSPNSFERLRTEHSDYFYKPKRGPSTSKSNITITRPIKHFETVKTLFDFLTKTTQIPSQEPTNDPVIVPETKSTSISSSLLSSMDDEDLSSSSSTTTTTTEFSSMLTVTEEEKIETKKSIVKEDYPLSPCHSPAIGINITSQHVHLALIELYPQNIDYSTMIFQRYLLSLIVDHEHENWSIVNVPLRTRLEQEGNFRLFTLTREEFDRILLHLQSFINYNSSIASSFVLNIALTGEQTKDYEMKIATRLNKINLNFDIIQYRAESYMIGLEFFHSSMSDELIEILPGKTSLPSSQFYPYLLVHAEASSTFFYIVHSSSQYSFLTSTNLSYKTYSNLLKLIQPGFEPTTSRCVVSNSFDFTPRDLCKHCQNPSKFYAMDAPLSSLARISPGYFPRDYSLSKSSHYIYRGWSNRRLISSEDQTRTMFDVPTQTDDSYLQSSSLQTRLTMQRSLLSMLTMNMALILKLILQFHPSIEHCIFTGEFFELERDAAEDLTRFVQSMLSERRFRLYQLRRESLIGALGCALPRVYFDVIDEHIDLGQDCIY